MTAYRSSDLKRRAPGSKQHKLAGAFIMKRRSRKRTSRQPHSRPQGVETFFGGGRRRRSRLPVGGGGRHNGSLCVSNRPKKKWSRGPSYFYFYERAIRHPNKPRAARYRTSDTNTRIRIVFITFARLTRLGRPKAGAAVDCFAQDTHTFRQQAHTVWINSNQLHTRSHRYDTQLRYTIFHRDNHKDVDQNVVNSGQQNTGLRAPPASIDRCGTGRSPSLPRVVAPALLVISDCEFRVNLRGFGVGTGGVG